MSYRVRFTTHTGATGYWNGTFATRKGASMSAISRADVTGYTYTVEEVPDAPQWKEEPPRWMREIPRDTIMKIDNECLRAFAAKMWDAPKLVEVPVATPEPGSTAAHHVEILRERVKELEAMVETLRKNLNETLTDNDDIHRDLAFALDLGRAMREAMRTGEWRAGHDQSMANSAVAGWDRWKPSLGKAPSVTGAPEEGGDSDRRRLEALERWLRVDTYRLVFFASRGAMVAMSDSIGTDDMEAPTLAALADKLAEMEANP